MAPVGHDVQVSDLLGVLGHDLEETRIVNAVVIIVAGVHVQ